MENHYNTKQFIFLSVSLIRRELCKRAKIWPEESGDCDGAHRSSRDAIVEPIERIGAVHPLGSVNQSALCVLEITVTFGQWPATSDKREFIQSEKTMHVQGSAGRAWIEYSSVGRIKGEAWLYIICVCAALSLSLTHSGVVYWFLPHCTTIIRATECYAAHETAPAVDTFFYIWFGLVRLQGLRPRGAAGAPRLACATSAAIARITNLSLGH